MPFGDTRWCWACGCDAPHGPPDGNPSWYSRTAKKTCACCGRPCNVDIELPPTRCEKPKCVAARVAERLTGDTLTLADLEQAYEAAKFGAAEPNIYTPRRR